MDIQQLRHKIDIIDTQLVELFVERMKIAADVAAYKKENGLPIYVPSREQEKLQDVERIAGPEMGNYTRQLYTAIMDLSKDYQKTKIDADDHKYEKKFGLLGASLSHSYSPQIHSHLGSYSYRLFEKNEEELDALFSDQSLTGLNVTIPYKKTVVPFCQKLTPQAKCLGAVNTMIRQKDGTWIGHNTDYFGFYAMANRVNVDYAGKKVLILGSGGASNTASVVMQELGAEVIVVSRTGENNYTNLHLHKDCAVIINTTPVGMYPNNGISPVDLSKFPNLEAVLDLIYNPIRTKLLMDAENQGLKTENGLWMLVAQAKESAEWFTGKQIDNSVIATIYQKLRRQMENIILIGMPGCGKSTNGKLLAKALGKTFVDTDEEIIKLAGCTIPQIFSAQGEDGFRKLETTVLENLGKCSGLIISTGGGCVTRAENLPLLRQNGTVIWLKRAAEQLATKGRPLSDGHDLNKMYEVRRPLYQMFSQHYIECRATPEETTSALLKLLETEVYQ